MSNPPDNPIKNDKRKKLTALRQLGVNPYPYSFDKNCYINELNSEFSELSPGDKKEDTFFKIAGRMMALRDKGKAVFF